MTTETPMRIWADQENLTWVEVYPGEAMQDYEDALTALEAFGLAEIRDRKASDTAGCRVAGERDYAAISAFMNENAGVGYGFAPAVPPSYYDDVHVRSRQFNNEEYNFLKERDGRLIAVLLMAVPPFDQVSSAATVRAAVFSGALDEQACVECLRDLLRYARHAFDGEFAKFRFPYSDARQDWLRDALLQEGFSETCTLRREIANRVDLTLYDRVIG